MSMVNTREANALEFVFRDNATAEANLHIDQTVSSTAYIGLCTASPGEDGSTTANELASGDGYERKSIVVNDFAGTPFFGIAASGSTDNGTELSWTATANWAAAVTHFLIDDSAVEQSQHEFYGSLTQSVTVLSSDVVKFKVGDMTISMSGLFSYDRMNAILDIMFQDEDGVSASTLYFGLSTTTPSPDNTNVTEPAGGSYARVSKTPASVWAAASAGAPSSMTTAQDITWPEATASWGTLTHWVCYDASTSGNLIAYGALDSSQAVGSGDQVKFGIGDLTVTMD